MRAGKLNPSVDFNTFYVGEEAVNLGLADGIETYHSAFSKVSL